jgi:hypothetical protein
MRKRISVDDFCKDTRTCQSVWEDDEHPGESADVVVVGIPAEPGTVPLAPGEIAIRVRRQIITDVRAR